MKLPKDKGDQVEGKPDQPTTPRLEAYDEAGEIVEAIRSGSVDAFVMPGRGGDRILMLDEAHKAYLILLEQVREGALTLNDKGYIIFCGTRLARMLGAESHALRSRPFEPFVQPDQHESYRQFLAAALAGEAVGEFSLQPRDGGLTLPVRISARPLELEEGGDRVICAVVSDLTEMRLLERLARSEERYRLAARASNDMIWEIDLARGEIHVNEAMFELFGYEERTVDREVWEQRIHPDDRNQVLASRQALFRNHAERWEYEYRFRRADGSYAWVHNRAFLIRTADGQPSRMIGAMMDLTERKNHEQKLKELATALEQRVEERTAAYRDRTAQLRRLAIQLTQVEQQERQRFADLLHNDLQQILVSIAMRINTLERRVDDPARSDVHELRDLIQDAIGKTRGLTVELSPPILRHGTLAEALGWIADMMHRQHELTVELDIDEQIEPDSEGIKRFIFDATRELLFNTVKHARVSRASVRLQRIHDRLRLSLSDAGAGCDLDELTARSDSGRHFGLLAITERADILGGQVQIDTAPGRGFHIQLDLPMHEAQLEEDETAPPDTLEQRTPDDTDAIAPVAATSAMVRLVVADDHNMVRAGIVNMLGEEKDMLVVGEAHDGQEAVELAHRLKPDIIIMDINMPRLNGIQATRQLRSDLPEVCIIGLSVNHDQSTIRAMREAGALAYVRKDAPLEELVEVIRECIGHSSSEPQP